MNREEKFIKQLTKIYRTAFLSNMIKLILISLFIILSTILIWNKFEEKEYMTIIFLIIADIVFIGLAIILFKMSREYSSLKNSRINHCIHNPDLISEIIITPTKIVFEIKGMEDETILIKESKFKSELITNIKEVFGNNNIVKNH